MACKVECFFDSVICKDVLRMGRFRWAACQLDDLKDCLDYRSLHKALASLPTTLDETYKRILKGIPDKQKPYATKLLQFLTYSERPLKIEEAIDAIAVDTEENPYFDPKYRMPDPQEIACYCSSLVVVVPIKEYSYDEHNSYDGNMDEGDTDEGDDSGDLYKSYGEHVKLQLAHFSVKEYLMSGRLDEEVARDFHEVAAKASIATVCLAYLLQLNQNIGIKKIREMFPLAQYSARYWMDHAAMAEGKNGKLQRFIEKLFCHHRDSYWNCYSLYRPDRPWDNDPAKRQWYPAPALYYASFGGLVNAVQHILSQGADVHAQSKKYGNALQIASSKGHEKIAELLLKKGADVNTQGFAFGGNALLEA
jgi:hypothetical protein